MSDNENLTAKLIDVALARAGERGWRRLSMAEIAEAADVPIGILRTAFADKSAILEAFRARIDAEVLTGTDEEDWQDEDEPRDRLFDVLMQRFDALAPYKAGLREIHGDLRLDLLALLARAPGIVQSMRWMLEAAKLPSDGLRGLVSAQGLAAIYARILPIWLADEDPGLPRTMAELDSRLRDAEKQFATVDRIGSALAPGWGSRNAGHDQL